MLIRSWRKQQNDMRGKLRDSRVGKFLGKRLDAQVLWKITPHTIAGGLSVGLFVALTPTFPFQMLLAALLAVYFNVNLPIAMIACWVTNPLTAVPIYGFCWWVGKEIFENVEFLKHFLLTYSAGGGRMGRIFHESIYFWVGTLVVAAISAGLANILVRVLWRFIRDPNDPDDKDDGTDTGAATATSAETAEAPKVEPPPHDNLVV